MYRALEELQNDAAKRMPFFCAYLVVDSEDVYDINANFHHVDAVSKRQLEFGIRFWQAQVLVRRVVASVLLATFTSSVTRASLEPLKRLDEVLPAIF